MSDHYLFAETAFLHEGDFDYMLKLVDKIGASVARGVKFQVLTEPSDFISSKHDKYAQLKEYCFSIKQWRKIFQRALDRDLELILMPLNIGALTLCDEFNVKWIEIHSVSQNDWVLKKKIKDGGYNIIITTGGRYVQEVQQDLNFFGNNVQVIMVGFQAFPSDLSDIRIGQIQYWKKQYPNLLIGYADHSLYSSKEAFRSLDYAYFLGARVFEKHVTMEPGVERVDSSAAISCSDLEQIEFSLRFLGKYIITERINPGDFSNAELVYRKRQLVCVASRDIDVGESIQDKDVLLKMHHQNVNVFDNIQDLIGKELTKGIEKDELFNPSLFE